MTISLAVIILECTGDITFGVPIILSLFVSKWIGDFFNPVSLHRETKRSIGASVCTTSIYFEHNYTYPN